MLLAYRTWTPEHDRSASLELLEGVRWAVFAEKAVVMLLDAQQAAALSVDPRMPVDQLRANVQAKQAGAADVARLRPLLFPED